MKNQELRLRKKAAIWTISTTIVSFIFPILTQFPNLTRGKADFWQPFDSGLFLGLAFSIVLGASVDFCFEKWDLTKRNLARLTMLIFPVFMALAYLLYGADLGSQATPDKAKIATITLFGLVFVYQVKYAILQIDAQRKKSEPKGQSPTNGAG